ncbi:MAG: 5-formyltetrahydrofolate cyclo-ligase [Acidobacteriota bacterium]
MSRNLDPMGPSPGTQPGANLDKPAWRERLRSQLGSLPPDQAARNAAQMADAALTLPEVTRGAGILICLSFGDEIDTWGLVQRLRDLGKAVFVPRVQRKGMRLHVHRYPCPLRRLSFGLRQPAADSPAVPEGEILDHVHVALVTGLGFDRRGIRLGYGGGYFDRFFARVPIPRIGMAHHLQLVETLPRDPHDLPMAAVVTESGVHRP